MEKAYHVEYVSKASSKGIIIEDGLTAASVARLFACKDIMVVAVWILF